MPMTHRFAPFFLALLLGLLGVSCQADDPAKPLGNPVAATEAWQRIEAGALLVDVRSAEEFAAGHLDGAVNIPYTEVDRIAGLIGEDKQRSVVLYCRSGNRSGKATDALRNMGYTGVFNGTGLEALQATQP